MMFTNGERLQSLGIQSDVFVGNWGSRRAIKKVSGDGLTNKDLERIVIATPEYRQDLQRGGIRVPDNLSTRIVDGRLETVDDYVHGHIVTGENKREWKRMVEIIATPGVFIDGKPPNFVQNGRCMYYVDTFPPMLRDGVAIAPWIQKLFKRNKHMMSFNFGDVRGRLTKLLSLTKIGMPRKYNELSNLTLDVARQTVKPSDYEYVLEQHKLGLPDMAQMYKQPKLSGFIARRLLSA